MAGISTRTWAPKQNQFEVWSPGKPTADDLTTEKEENKLTYVNKSKFSFHDKIKLQTRGFDTAERYAAAQKQLSLERGTAEIEETAFDAAFDEIIETDPDLHDAYVRPLSEALKGSRSIGRT